MNVLKRAADSFARNEALDKVGDRISAALDKALAKVPQRRKVEDALHGKWLGHPLHPPLTDIPIGAWTFAVVLDAGAMIRGERSRGAEHAIQFGMLTAVPTAIAGAIDWRQTSGEARRVGVAHALMNNAALGLFGLSLVLRGNHLMLARLLSMGAFVVVSASGYLGGHLISNMRIGVKHIAEPAGSPTYFSEASVDGGLVEDTPRKVEVEGMPMMVVRHGGRLYALSDVCSHLGCSLSEGTISGDAIVCPCHGSTFALEDGSVLHGPSTFPVQSYRPSLPGADISPGPVLDLGTE